MIIENIHGAVIKQIEGDLQRADLRGANCPDFHIWPAEGSFLAYKKTNKGVIQIEIPATAKRTSCLRSRKCRAEFVKTIKGNGKSGRGGVYREGEYTYADKYNDDIRVEYSYGIHFFVIHREAEEWSF